MIVVNGTVELLTVVGGGVDEKGNPIRPTSSWSNPIPCHIRNNTHSKLGRSEGNLFTIATYEVLVDQPISADKVRLTRYGQELGEFLVISIELLFAVKAIKILV